MLRSLLCCTLALACLSATSAQPPQPKGPAPAATPAAAIKAAKGFAVELLYSVPRESQGSWVNLCVDPKGRLIVSDQYGGLYRVTVPAIGGKPADTKIEKIPAAIGEAQGLLWAFDALYVVVNRGGKYASGLYRVTSSDNSDNLDKVELLRGINGGGEHGPHAVLLSPDKKSLTIVCGNQTKLMDPVAASRVPKRWGEDHLLKRLPDGNGFMAGVMGPGGAMYKVDPAGKNWELLSVGFRNQYDAAFNREGELFTYDADMEWDMNTPWYRPTRVNHVTSGSEFGWRNGAGKWPAYYADSLGSVADIGPGSPTGVTFGYGAKFPAKYQDAFYVSDWSYGKLYAVHLAPSGSSYKGTVEEFVTGTPLPLTDVVVNPLDGAMYFAVGGRRTQSGLYRVTYTGTESTAPSKGDPEAGAKARAARHALEAFHGKADPKAVAAAWEKLGDDDREIRFAARVAIEHQPVKEWADKALAEKDANKAIPALLALTRCIASDPFHRKAGEAKPDEATTAKVFAALKAIDYAKLDDVRKLDYLRTVQVALNRLGAPKEDDTKPTFAGKFDALFPAKTREQTIEMLQILVFLESPGIAAKALDLLDAAPTQEQQLDIGRSLRVLKATWTPDLRKRYFTWFVKAQGFRGGNSMGGFLRLMKADAVANVPKDELAALKPILDAKPVGGTPIVGKPRPVIKTYKVDDLTAALEKGLKGGRDYERGRKLFAEARCFVCHRYDNEGGSLGPDLTGVAGRFSPRDLLESIIEPSKTISDQYAAVEIETTRGKTVRGRIANLNADNIMINTDMEDPNAMTAVNRKTISSMTTSKLSMMPTGLLDGFNEGEIVDLMAYVLSRGNRADKMFK